MLPTLLKLCKLVDQSLLPPFYTVISKGYKCKGLPYFQGGLNRLSYANITYNMEPPVFSAKILRRVADINWGAHNDTYLEGGLTSWHTIYVDKSQQTDLQRHAIRYNLLMEGNTVSFANVDKFDAINSHVILLIKLSQVKRLLETYIMV